MKFLSHLFPTVTDLAKIAAEGQKAFLDGKRRNDNPYLECMDSSLAWLKGYSSAEHVVVRTITIRVEEQTRTFNYTQLIDASAAWAAMESLFSHGLICAATMVDTDGIVHKHVGE